MFEQFITKQNDREAVFHAPLSRLLLLPFAALFGCSDLYLLSHPLPLRSLYDWVVFIILVLFATAVTLVLIFACFPAELRLDFAQRTYASRVGIAPLLIERSGCFDDLQCVFTEQLRGHRYQIGVAVKNGVRCWLYPFDRGYRFITTTNKGAAEKYAEDIASQMAVPYFGLLPYGDELPDSI